MKSPPGYFRVDLEAKCPFCKGTFMAGYIDDEPAVIHTKPSCKTFAGTECPADFLESVRKALGGMN